MVDKERKRRKPFAGIVFGPGHWLVQAEEESDTQCVASVEVEENLPAPNPKRSRLPTKDQELIRAPAPQNVAAFIPSKGWVPVENSDINDLAHHLDTNRNKLSKWEENFFDSVTKWVKDRGGLTVKQYETLENISDKLDYR